MMYVFRTRRRPDGRMRRRLLGALAIGMLPVALSGVTSNAPLDATPGAWIGVAVAATPAAVDDTVVAGAIRRALATEFGPSASSIWVEVYRGAVYLSGGLPTAAERQRVETIAAGVRGVISVQSEFDGTPPSTRLAGR